MAFAIFRCGCLPNMNAQQVAERIVPGVKLLREAHAKTPILLGRCGLQHQPGDGLGKPNPLIPGLL